MEIKGGLITVGHLVLNAIDSLLIQRLFNPVTIETVHISFDDVYESFFEVIKNNCSSIFENSFFRGLKKLNNEFDAKFSLYLFEDETCVLTPSMIQELEECETWLSVGYHSRINGKTDVESFHRFQRQFCHSRLMSKRCRLHQFSGDDGLILEMKKAGVCELFCADDGRTSYGILSDLYLGGYYKEGLYYTPTDIRLEKLCFRRLLNLKDKKRVVIFGHEIPFKKYHEIQKLEAILRRLPTNVEFDY